MLYDGWDANVPRGTFLLLKDYCEELIKWNGSINLISKKDSQDFQMVMRRHIMDCAQIMGYIIPAEATVLDIGSGSGLPGMVLAICGAKRVVLIEPDHKKCAFLRHVSAMLNVECQIKTLGMEEYIHGSSVDIITSRAFASCEHIISGCLHNIGPNTKLILLKSAKQIDKELEGISSLYHFALQIDESRVSNEGRIITITNIQLK